MLLLKIFHLPLAYLATSKALKTFRKFIVIEVNLFYIEARNNCMQPFDNKMKISKN